MLSAHDLEDLELAHNLLENPGLAARISAAVGTPLEAGFDLLPQNARELIAQATRQALDRALTFALVTLDDRPRKESTEWVHKLMAATTGAAGGFFGLPALAVELPISTTIMLRSIADVARSEGEHIKTAQTKMACLEVFALGGRRPGDDASESGYFFVRGAMAKAMAEAAEFVAQRGLTQETAPVMVRFLVQIAQRFSIPVTQKVAAQMLPVVGAAGGALLNTLFMDHFQNMARGHFIVRRLERVHGSQIVRRAYDSLPQP
ncbi:MAG TPA: EcsC family protein [Candidatus Limnocylindrales bacterium]|nr:EcsC family protein [Candidatus Limnocylindrales bacterium]